MYCCICGNISLPSGVQGENAAEQDSHCGFFHYHQGQLGTAKERDFESYFSARTLLPCRPARDGAGAPGGAVPWPCARVARTDVRHLRPSLGLAEAPEAPPCSSLPRADSQLGLAPVCVPSCSLRRHTAFPRPPASTGPFLSGSCSLAHWAQPSPAHSRGGAEEPGCRSLLLPCPAEVPRSGAALSPGQSCLAPPLVWYAAQTSYTSTAVLQPPRPAGQDTRRPPGRHGRG